MYSMYLDDERMPKTKGRDWVIVRSVKEAWAYMCQHGCPSYISFDHDLGSDVDAMHLVRRMIERDLKTGGNFIPADFEFNVHSANVCGKANIEGLLNSYMKTVKGGL